jgi:hypothetical protein
MIEEIKLHPHCNVYENYPADYAGVDNKGRALLKNLETFGKVVLEDLWEAIQMEFPEATEPINEWALEQRAQIMFKVIPVKASFLPFNRKVNAKYSMDDRQSWES